MKAATDNRSGNLRSDYVDILLLLIFRPGPLTSRENWSRFFRSRFPHVDFSNFRLGDVLRCLVQFLWLLIVRSRPRNSIPLLRNFIQLGVRLARAAHMASIRRSVNLASKSRNFERGRLLQVAQHPAWNHPCIQLTGYAVTGILAFFCITTPFSLESQLIFVVLLMAAAVTFRNIAGPLATLVLILLSVTASSRYLWWRISYTLNWESNFDLAWGLLLFLAELYTWIILILGYMQTSWMLQRSPKPLSGDPSGWPTIDIFIPTYNEPLKVVATTVHAALGIDWPADKLHVYLLDDGRRNDFRDFAEDAGIRYIARPDNRHAKAGNLNHAIGMTDGDFIVVFDCDHIPSRSFLQTTMGWFASDAKLALLQTPHHFFSPDPFERNLRLVRKMPNEGELFYGVIQDGNDLWNATFFCGSCAVIKRGPLESIGGIAVETVTEDAHTALKLQRLGYTSAYINIPQAAGLATESLAAHIGQRIRWARGMAQILRLDNPFFGKGLSFMQRICYGNAMLHFFNGAPRLIFLTAPLAFLVFHAYVIYAPAIAVVLYVLPHMVHANITNSRIQGKHRYSFWAEVYETVLAWYILRPTTVALINPRKGKFNVTAKGGMVESDYFDWPIALPYLLLVLLNLVGCFFGVARLAFGPSHEIPTTLLNLAWTGYNVLLLGAAISVASETRQVRQAHRVDMRMPAIVHLPSGKLLHSHTINWSEGGAALAMDCPVGLDSGDQVFVSLWRGDEEHAFPARIIGLSEGEVQIAWALRSSIERRTLVQCTFSRADAWTASQAKTTQDVPMQALVEVLHSGINGFRQVTQHAAPFVPFPAKKVAVALRWAASFRPRRIVTMPAADLPTS